MSAALNFHAHLLKQWRIETLQLEQQHYIITSASNKDSEFIRLNIWKRTSFYLSSFNFGLAEYLPKVKDNHLSIWLCLSYIFYVSGQQRDEILPVTGKAILCNGSCFTVAAFQREVQYLNMWYPVPNQNILSSRCKDHTALTTCIYLNWHHDKFYFRCFHARRGEKKEEISLLAVLCGKFKCNLNFFLYLDGFFFLALALAR